VAATTTHGAITRNRQQIETIVSDIRASRGACFLRWNAKCRSGL
jgi:hypothetical protein